jgi:hypothetical protein
MKLENFLGVSALLVVVFLLWMAVSACRSDGKITYCYIEQTFARYDVRGHREWRTDVTIGTATRPEEADKLLRDSVLCSR